MISDELASTEQRFRAAEHDVERASAALKKELRLVDLVGIQILNIVGLHWVGTAGKLGSSHTLSGFLMTLLYVVLSIFPIIDVSNPWLFTVKIVAVVGGLQCAGTVYYRWKTLPRGNPPSVTRPLFNSM